MAYLNKANPQFHISDCLIMRKVSFIATLKIYYEAKYFSALHERDHAQRSSSSDNDAGSGQRIPAASARAKYRVTVVFPRFKLFAILRWLDFSS